MSQWKAKWFELASKQTRILWRAVEAQHRVATMRLADSLEDQLLLEQMLDQSKPPRAPGSSNDYLIYSPFRYTSKYPSRFRPNNELGAWHGADTPQTVAAEIAHWRWRFVIDSDITMENRVEFTFFQAKFTGIELNLTQSPWSKLKAIWTHPSDYSKCHQLANELRTNFPDVQSIRYESVRDPNQGFCQVVFDENALQRPNKNLQQTWVCLTSDKGARLFHDEEYLEFKFSEIKD